MAELFDNDQLNKVMKNIQETFWRIFWYFIEDWGSFFSSASIKLIIESLGTNENYAIKAQLSLYII